MMEGKRFKIFVVLPMYGGSLTVGRYCVMALQKLGCAVGVFEAPALFDAFNAFKKLKLSPDDFAQLEQGFLHLVSQAVWKQANSFKPDFVLALAQAPIGVKLLTKFKAAHIPAVMWFVEDYKVFPYWKIVAPHYDAFAIIQKEPFIRLLHECGQKNVLYLPLAAEPDFHSARELSETEREEYGSDLSFLGAGYPNRRLAFRKFADKDFKIWGSDWEDEDYLKANIQRQGTRISEEESVKIYNASKINLNLHSSIQTERLVSGGDFVNPRTFELASIGAFQLTDKRSLMGELFADDELATFESLNELDEKIDYFLNHEEERKKYAARARKRVLQDHTYSQRMITLIDYMEKIAGPFKTPEKDNSISGFEEPFKTELTGLLDKLELGRNASFEDLIIKLRERSGKLSETEMAILFLDEFHKQYKKR